MSKFTLSNSYIDEQKSNNPALEKNNDRKAIIIGSDFKSNIGFHINNKFVENEISTKCYNKDTLNMTRQSLPVENDDDILVLANGYTYLEWIENLDDDVLDFKESNPFGDAGSKG